MNCKELVYLLGDYLDGSMDESLRKELDCHIAMCDSCKNFLATYDKTRIICRQVTLQEIPEEFRARLRSFVMRMAEERHGGIEKYVRLAAEERSRQVDSLVAAYREKRLTSAAAVLFDAHRDRCPRCGAFLRSLNGGERTPDVPPEVADHLAGFFDALPAGEDPFLP
jgi:anti-sigma factor RsiW